MPFQSLQGGHILNFSHMFKCFFQAPVLYDPNLIYFVLWKNMKGV